MDSIQNNALGGIKYLQKQTSSTEAPKIQEPQIFQTVATTPVEDGDKKSQDILKWAGVIAAGTLAVGGTIYALKKGKTAKLKDIKFTKGTASLKEGGKKFSGVIKDTLKDGDTIKMTYKDGVLQKSVRKGKTSFVKEYAYADGKISKVIKDGKEINIGKLSEEGAQKAKKLQAEAAEKAEKAAQEAAEKAAQEAADRAAKKAAEIAAKEASEKAAQEAEKLHIESIVQEASKRTKLEQQTSRAQEVQEEVFKQMHGNTTNKSARDSARAFMSPAERVNDIVQDKDLTTDMFNHAQERASLLKKADPELISSLSDSQIASLLTHGGNQREVSEILNILKNNFTKTDLERISKGEYHNVFIDNLFNATKDELEGVIKWYSR